ncbi:MAG: leucine-rich repeat domain-containing protein, partial [Clostridia bacterium]|nr:leucine-rich repeat domain-containing protein [Clostridia bacterium]
MGIKTLSFSTYAGNGKRSSSTILFCYLPNTLTALPFNLVQESNVIVVDIDFETPVKEIPQNFAHGAFNLTSIKIPSSVEKINGNSAQNGAPFYNCKSLESVTFGPDSKLTTLLNDVFNGCSSLKSIELPSTVTSMGVRIFSNTTSLESAPLPDDLETIPDETFRNSGIINWPLSENTSVSSFGNWAFYGADNLTSAYIPAAVSDLSTSYQSYGIFANCTSLQTVVFEEGSQLTGKLEYTFKNCSSLESISFDLDCPLTEIGNSAFQGCLALKEIILPHKVEYVHNRAFQASTGSAKGALETVNLGPSFKGFINDGGDTWFFYNQPNLKSITFPAITADDVTADWIQLINSCSTPTIYYTGTAKQWTDVLAKVNEVANKNNGTFLSITEPVLVDVCTAFYKSVHDGEESVKFADDMFVSTATLQVACTRCGNTETIETVAPLFHFNGFSYEEGTDSGKVMQAFAIDKSVLDFYTERFGAISYGLVAAVNTYYVDSTPNTIHTGTLFDVNEGVLTAKEKVAHVDFTERNYDLFEMGVTGLTGNNAGTSIYLCAYIFVDGQVYYLN